MQFDELSAFSIFILNIRSVAVYNLLTLGLDFVRNMYLFQNLAFINTIDFFPWLLQVFNHQFNQIQKQSP